jgi:hypothetical protein
MTFAPEIGAPVTESTTAPLYVMVLVDWFGIDVVPLPGIEPSPRLEDTFPVVAAVAGGVVDAPPPPPQPASAIAATIAPAKKV